MKRSRKASAPSPSPVRPGEPGHKPCPECGAWLAHTCDACPACGVAVVASVPLTAPAEWTWIVDPTRPRAKRSAFQPAPCPKCAALLAYPPGGTVATCPSCGLALRVVVPLVAMAAPGWRWEPDFTRPPLQASVDPAATKPARPCPHCGKACPPGYVTCGRSECQQAETAANRARNAAPAPEPVAPPPRVLLGLALAVESLDRLEWSDDDRANNATLHARDLIAAMLRSMAGGQSREYYALCSEASRMLDDADPYQPR